MKLRLIVGRRSLPLMVVVVDGGYGILNDFLQFDARAQALASSPIVVVTVSRALDDKSTRQVRRFVCPLCKPRTPKTPQPQ